jgi:hypothetical protein
MAAATTPTTIYEVITGSELESALSEEFFRNIDDISNIDLDIGVFNSRKYRFAILNDHKTALGQRFALIFISSLTSSHKRLSYIIDQLAESNFKNLLSSAYPLTEGTGRKTLYHLAHLSAAFPGHALIGRLMFLTTSLKKETVVIEEFSEPAESKGAGDAAVELAKVAYYNNLSKYIEKIFFPGMAGLNLDSELQKKQRAWEQNYYTTVVRGTKFEDHFYDLKAGDTWEWYRVDFANKKFIPQKEPMKENDLLDLLVHIYVHRP